METALVGVGTGVMKPLLSKLSTLLEKENAKLKGVRRNTKFIRDEMATMSATLQMLAEIEELDPQMKIWRDNVRELSYDMEDCVDDFMAHVDHERDGDGCFKFFFRKIKKLKPRHEIANEIEELKVHAIDASERHKRYNIVRLPAPYERYNIVQPTPDSSTCAIDPRLHAIYVEVDKLVGIGGPKKHIIDWFEMESSSSQLKVVSIVGPGGLGKTTLANQVYCTTKDQFSCSAFVSVSRDPNMVKILRDIAEGVGIINTTSNDDLQRLIDRLRERLQDQKYFIVIDDIWDAEAWETISLALLNNNRGSRIITTTRNNAVASFSCPQGNKVYPMEPLSHADSKRLFFKRALGSEDLCYPHLKEMSDKILEKCAGLPLAIITISSLLTDQTAASEWNRILTAIGSAFAKNPNAEKMTKILSLSYFDLPRHLRTCLLYLSMFPEDYIIEKECLISRWIAEGFIHEEQGLSTYEIGEGYLNDLINRSLVQPVGVEHGQVKACRVHDIILDFIACKAIEENFVTSFDDAEHGNISHHRVRRLCAGYQKEAKATIPASLKLSHVRSLTVFRYFEQSCLSDFPALRVLDLVECWDLQNHHLANIEKLFLLKYLRIGGPGITELPVKIGDLHYLQTLDIQGTNIRKLPSTISRLQRLARLYVPREAMFPDGIIGQMQSLEVLNVLNVISHKQGKSLQEIGQLTKLRTLAVSFRDLHCTGDMMDFQSYVGTLIASCNLRHLHITYICYAFPWFAPVSLELLCLTTAYRLQKLHLRLCYIDKIPNWMKSHGNLRDLDFSMYRLSPEDIAILGAIPALVFLKLVISYGRNGRISIHGFRSLKYFNLEITCCGTALEFQAGSMPKLEHLELGIKPHKVECLNGAPSDLGIHHLSALTEGKVVIRVRSDTADEVVRLIEIAVGTLPNRPTLSFMRPGEFLGPQVCEHFAEYFNKRYSQAEEWRRAGNTFSYFCRIAGEINQDAYSMSTLEGAGQDK